MIKEASRNSQITSRQASVHNNIIIIALLPQPRNTLQPIEKRRGRDSRRERGSESLGHEKALALLLKPANPMHTIEYEVTMIVSQRY